jgi:hypothetical protein
VHLEYVSGVKKLSFIKNLQLTHSFGLAMFDCAFMQKFDKNAKNKGIVKQFI